MPHQIYLGTLAQSAALVTAVTAGRQAVRPPRATEGLRGRRRRHLRRCAVRHRHGRRRQPATWSAWPSAVSASACTWPSTSLSSSTCCPTPGSTAKDLGVLNIAGALPFALAPALAPVVLGLSDNELHDALRRGRRLCPPRSTRRRPDQSESASDRPRGRRGGLHCECRGRHSRPHPTLGRGETLGRRPQDEAAVAASESAGVVAQVAVDAAARWVVAPGTTSPSAATVTRSAIGRCTPSTRVPPASSTTSP